MSMVFRRRRRTPRLAASLALVGAAVVLAGCQEVPSNLVKSQPYELEPTADPDIQRVRLADRIAKNIDLQTAEVTANGAHKLVPHAALIYNPEGKVFVYTKPEPQVYVRAPVTVGAVSGDQVVLSDGPHPGTLIVTVGAAELLATEYEILNQHP
jgi:hypothetical protein